MAVLGQNVGLGTMGAARNIKDQIGVNTVITLVCAVE